METSAFSSLMPNSSEISFPPVRIAISASISFFLSPNPGAFSAKMEKEPRNLFTTNVASASPSTSSAMMINSFLPVPASFSKSGSTSFMVDIFLSVIKIDASVYSASMRSALVIMYGETYPLSKRIPSTTSDSMPNDCDSSTVTTPSFPTFPIALAIMVPISSDSADIVATCFISSDFLISLALARSASTTAFAAASMPSRMPIAFTPLLVCLSPSSMIAWVSTTAVVVPSPAISLVLFATSFTISAPIFSNLSGSVISLAIDTPSLVMTGAP